MILNKIDDPRDNLERAKLGELVRFAQANGLTHVTYDMPAILIRQELRQRRLVDIRIPARPLGSTPQRPGAITTAPPTSNDKIVEVNAASDLARQWEQQKAQPKPAPLKSNRPPRLRERPRSEINVMRDTCKRLGIKMDRRDNKATLKAKIEAHGQNPPQQRQ